MPRLMREIAAGRSAPENVIGLLHHQPTLSSIVAAEKALGQGWTPVEVAVAALARAREADQAGDRSACDQTLAQVQHTIEPAVLMSLP